MNNVNFLEEKLWILLLSLKRANFEKRKFKDEHEERRFMRKEWSKWWKSDFNKCDLIDIIFPFVKENINLSQEEIMKERRKYAVHGRTPKYIQDMASEHGYIVQKAATSNHPLRVSGYRICEPINNGKFKVIAGSKFDLTLDDVKNYLKYGDLNE